jgi:hypothetical protein
MIKTTGATDGYITPAEAKRKGLTKKDGVYYKRTVLEKYRDKGWLGQVTSQYSDDDRMVAGLRLAADFYKAGYSGFNCLDYEKPRVESSPLFDPSPAVLDARDRYGKAIACLTREEVFAVRMVCCLDEEIKIPHLRDDQYKNDLELLKRYISTGLNRLCEHYWGKIRMPRPQIVGQATVNFWDNIEDYYKEIGK